MGLCGFNRKRRELAKQKGIKIEEEIQEVVKEDGIKIEKKTTKKGDK